MTASTIQDQYELRALDATDLALVGQVDRSESNTAEYVALPSDDGLSLRLTRVPVDPPSHIPPWGEAAVAMRIGWWKPEVEAGGFFLGAFHQQTLCGFGVLGPVKEDRSIELHALFVDAGCRRSGVGGLLLRELERAAMRLGASSVWCGSNRTASAVEFYLKHGYRVISLNSNAVVRHRSGDPVMAKLLRRNDGG